MPSSTSSPNRDRPGQEDRSTSTTRSTKARGPDRQDPDHRQHQDPRQGPPPRAQGQEQERFSGTKLKKSRDALNRLGFFQEVNLTTQRGRSEEKLNLQVDVKEGQTGSLTAGAGSARRQPALQRPHPGEQPLRPRPTRRPERRLRQPAPELHRQLHRAWLFDIPLTHVRRVPLAARLRRLHARRHGIGYASSTR